MTQLRGLFDIVKNQILNAFHYSAMKEEKQTGILLQTLLYGERDFIIKLFTKERGLLTCFAKKRSSSANLFIPFSEGEWLYRRGRSSLFSLMEASLLQAHLNLRVNLQALMAAGKIAELLLSSQLPEKPSPVLYELLRSYISALNVLKEDSFSHTLTASFYLKYLRHEGHLGFSSRCNRCSQEAFFLDRGESRCQQHKELLLLEQLLQARRFSQLFFEIEQAFLEKIIDLAREIFGKCIPK
jgi:DNA repair protein RecO